MKNKQFIFLSLIVIVAALLRFYKIITVPPGLYIDEASIGYNAYSILISGRDEYGKELPLIFQAFGEYKLPIYIYTVSLCMMFFQSVEFAIRFPSAIAGVISVFLTYYLVLELFTDNQNKFLIALFSSLFLAISPWHLHFSRGGFEANLALLLLIAAMLLFIKAVKNKSNLLSVSIILFVLAFATYNSARIFSPLLFIALFINYKNDLLKQNKQLRNAIIIGLLCLLPFLPQFISGEAILRAGSEGIQEEKNPIERFFSNYLANFDTTYLFFRGDQNGRHSVRKLGMLHAFELPLIILAINYFLKKKKFTTGNKLLFAWFFLAPIPSALTKINPHALRGLNILPTWHIFSAVGLVELSKIIDKMKLTIRIILRLGISLIILYSLAFYLHRYHVIYIREAALDWASGVKEAITLIKSNQKDFNKIYMTRKIEPVYIGLYLPIDPKKFPQLRDKGELENLKYFGQLSEVRKNGKEKILIISHWWQKPVNEIDYQEIKMLNRDVVFNIWEE